MLKFEGVPRNSGKLNKNGKMPNMIDDTCFVYFLIRLSVDFPTNRQKKRKPEMERVASGTDNSFVVAIVGNL